MNKGGVYIVRKPFQAPISSNAPGSQRVLVSPTRTPLSSNPTQVVSPVSYIQPIGRSSLGSTVVIKPSTPVSPVSLISYTTTQRYTSPKKIEIPRNVVTKSTTLSIVNIPKSVPSFMADMKSSTISLTSIPPKSQYTIPSKLPSTPVNQNVPVRVQPSSPVIVVRPKSPELQTPRLLSPKSGLSLGTSGIPGYNPSVTFHRETSTSSTKTSLSPVNLRTTTAPARVSSPVRISSPTRVSSPSKVSLQRPSTSPRKLSDY